MAVLHALCAFTDLAIRHNQLMAYLRATGAGRHGRQNEDPAGPSHGHSPSERFVDTQLGLAHMLQDADSLDQVVPAALAAVGLGLGWHHAYFWIDSGDEAFTCLEVWHAHGYEAPHLDEASWSTTIEPGEDLPGRTAMTGRTTWVDRYDRLDRQHVAPRAAAAGLDGVRTAICVPVYAAPHRAGNAGRVCAAIEFCAERRVHRDARTVVAIELLALQLGSLLSERHRSLDDLA